MLGNHRVNIIYSPLQLSISVHQMEVLVLVINSAVIQMDHSSVVAEQATLYLDMLAMVQYLCNSYL